MDETTTTSATLPPATSGLVTINAPAASPPDRPPLWLPDGSVRSILALTVIFADIYMQCAYKWAPAALDTMGALAFGYYFGAAGARPIK